MIRRALAVLLTPPDLRRVERLEAQNTVLRRENATLHKLSALLAPVVEQIHKIRDDGSGTPLSADPVAHAQAVIDDWNLVWRDLLAANNRAAIAQGEIADIGCKIRAAGAVDLADLIAQREREGDKLRAKIRELEQERASMIADIAEGFGLTRDGDWRQLLVRIARRGHALRAERATADARIVELSDLNVTLDARVAELTAQLEGERWIPIDEKVSEHRHVVLILARSGVVYAANYIGPGDGYGYRLFRTGFTSIGTRTSLNLDEIVAWRPLPAPPKEPK